MDEKKKKVIILGLGVTGYDVLNTLNKFKDRIIIVEDNKNMETAHKLKSDGYFYCDSNELEKSDVEVSFIIKSPGIMYNHPIVKKYKGVKIVNDIEMAYILLANSNVKIVAVTGTNGKTSTTTFITKLLKNAGLNAYSCGNIGVSPLKIIREYDNIDYLVMELSSFQLKAIDRFTPDYAFILNIEPDHLDYHGTIDDYILCKHNIISRGTKSGYCFINKDIDINNNDIINLDNDFEFEEDYYAYLNGLNIENVKLVYRFAKQIGISDEIFFDTIKDKYKGLEHRCEFVRNIDDVLYINDSKATNVAASSFALTQFKNIILLLGGYDKNEDMTQLLPFLDNVDLCICFGANRKKFSFIEKKIECENLESAVKMAHDIAKTGNVILLSPASASYDQYKNYEERGKHFKKLVGEL